MDQVRAFLAVLKKHHFWVLVGVVAALALVIWWTASAGMAGRIDEQMTALGSVYKDVKDIPVGGPHPNDKSVAKIQERHEGLRKGVFEAWEILQKDQKERNRWPEELGDECRDYIEQLGPDDEIPRRFRERYMLFIQNHFPEMCDIVDTLLPPKVDPKTGEIVKDEDGNPVKAYPFESSSGARPYSAVPEYSDEGMGPAMYGAGTPRGAKLLGTVEWNSSSLKRIWSDFHWQTTPETIRVRLAQENLWVYEALLRIIARTNAGAKNRYTAVVKRIESLEIGKDASRTFAMAMRPTTFGSRVGTGMSRYGYGEEGPEMYGGSYSGESYEETGDDASYDTMMSGMPGAGGEYGSPMMSGGFSSDAYGYGPGASGMRGATGTTGAAMSPEEQLRAYLTHGRYVEPNGMPLPANAEQPFAEFKMMPVRMRLIMDQRRISRLLVECANSDMLVEVRKVTMGGGTDLSRAFAGAGTGMPGSYPGSYPGGYGESYEEYDNQYSDGYMPSGPGYSGDTSSYSGYGMGGYGGARGKGQQTSYDAPVEVLGIIYIYNRPDLEKLGTGAGGEELAPPLPAMPAGPPPGGPAAPPPGGPAPGPAGGPGAAPTGPTTTPPAGMPTQPVGPGTTPPPGGPPAQPAGPPTGGSAVPPAGLPAAPPAGGPAATTPGGATGP